VNSLSWPKAKEAGKENEEYFKRNDCYKLKLIWLLFNKKPLLGTELYCEYKPYKKNKSYYGSDGGADFVISDFTDVTNISSFFIDVKGITKETTCDITTISKKTKKIIYNIEKNNIPKIVPKNIILECFLNDIKNVDYFIFRKSNSWVYITDKIENLINDDFKKSQKEKSIDIPGRIRMYRGSWRIIGLKENHLNNFIQEGWMQKFKI